MSINVSIHLPFTFSDSVYATYFLITLFSDTNKTITIKESKNDNITITDTETKIYKCTAFVLKEIWQDYSDKLVEKFTIPFPKLDDKNLLKYILYEKIIKPFHLKHIITLMLKTQSFQHTLYYLSETMDLLITDCISSFYKFENPNLFFILPGLVDWNLDKEYIDFFDVEKKVIGKISPDRDMIQFSEKRDYILAFGVERIDEFTYVGKEIKKWYQWLVCAGKDLEKIEMREKIAALESNIKLNAMLIECLDFKH